MLLPICVLLIVAVLRRSSCLTQEKTLMWTLKSTVDGSVDVRGVPGDPEDWVFNGINRYSNSFFSDPVSRQISRRLALAFQYSTSRVFFSDQGYKEIFRIILKQAPNVTGTVIFNVPIEVVYGGISTQVNGMAMDWASGSLYWTDALYNWITVANASDYNMAVHIVNTGLDRPMGLAVYPQKGLLFWSSLGAVPKIERSTLGGESRVNFVDTDIDRPLGLSIDYLNDHLYWVDDLSDTVERADLDDATKRWTMHIGYRHSLTGKLFGLAIYNDFIFASDQLYMTIDVFNKTAGEFITNFTASIVEDLPKGIPYDIMMYDSSLQEEIDSDCRRLLCADICISDGGKSAHCICQEGYDLSPVDDRSCVENATFRMPQYLYSVGASLCGTDIIAADQVHVPTDVRCFYNISGHEMVALGFNAYQGVLYFSDQNDHVIHRMILSNNIDSSAIDVVIANTGTVSGLSVDWIADNLYWTDEERGVIMVSQVTGRYAKVLFQNLDRPQSIAVNPLNGTLYWATPDCIHMANMDGTNARILVNITGANFDGMVLDIRRDLLFWVDQSLPGIRSCHMNGSDLTVVLQAGVTQNLKTFHDVTVYESYIAWTDDTNSVYFGVTSSSNTSLVNILRGFQHAVSKISHDIITYDTYLQPPLDLGEINKCDLDNDVLGCNQLCMLTPSGSQCGCSAGFTLVDNYCASEPLTHDFLLFVDPYYKIVYQYDLSSISSASEEADGSGSTDDRLRGIALQSANLPSLVAYDFQLQEIFWFDEDRLKNSIKQISIFEEVHYHTVSILDKGVTVTRIEAVDKTGSLLYTDSSSGSVFLISSEDATNIQRLAMQNVHDSAIAADECTGDIYWVDSATNNFNWCNLTESCFVDSTTNFITFFNSWKADRILGINIVRIVEERTVIVWTENAVYSIRSGSSTLLLTVDKSFNLTGVVMVNEIIYFASASQNAIYQYDIKTKLTNITVGGFSRISDLKLFLSPCLPQSVTSLPAPLPVANVGKKLGGGAIAGIIIGSIIFLLLLILLLVLLVVLCRRRRDKLQTTETAAYSNPTYARLSSIASTLSNVPEGAEGFSPYDSYNNNEGEKKDSPFPPAYDDLYFAEEAIAAFGFDGYLSTEEAPECEKKGELSFPEVCAVEPPPPIFKIDTGADSKAPAQPGGAADFYFDSNPSSLPNEEDASPYTDRDGSNAMM